MKKIFYVLGLIGIFFVFSTPVLASCSWEKETTSSTSALPGGTPVVSVSGGCSAKNLLKSGDSKCSGAKPTYSTNSGSSAVCCCDASEAAENIEPIIFTPPDLQIEIPGMEKLSKLTCTSDGQCEIPWLGQYVDGIYNYALSIAGILAAIMLMAGGLLWLISGGDASKITQAKDLIIGSITGLIILATSFIILLQINPDLVNLRVISISNISREDLADENWGTGNAAAQSVAKYCGCVDWKTLYSSSNLKTGSAIKSKLGNSPLAPYGDLIAQLSQQTNIDPALVLAIWLQDSSYATAGAGKTNKNPGNVRCGTKKSGPGWVCATSPTSGEFRKYDDYAVAIKDWYNVVGNGKRLNSSKNIRALIKTYAPPSDKNDTQGYINFVMSFIDNAHGGSLKASDGSAAALQKCADIDYGC